MNDAVRMLQYSAELVKAWGQAQLPSGKTLAETLSLQGFPLWEAIAVDLARLHVPKALTMDRQPSWFAQEVRPYLSWAKHSALNLLRRQQGSRGSPDWPVEPVFLFLGFSAYFYRDVLQPVVTRLTRSKDIATVSLHSELRLHRTMPPTQGDRFQSIWQHWDHKVEARLRALRHALRATVAELHAIEALPQIIRDHGEPIWPKMQEIFDWFFRVYLPRLLPQVVIARHILERYQPALVISPDVADPRTRLYCLLARQVGIPSLEIQFGAFGEDSIEWQFFVADRLAVWGDQAYEVMLAHGVPAGRITITGSPRHDCLINITDTDVTRIRARIGIPEGSVMVLFSSVYEEGGSEAFSNPENPNLISLMKRAVFQAADQAAGLCLVVKPHPLENARKTRQLAGKMRNIQFTDPRADNRELTKACDVFVAVTGSTTVTDALIANKLTIIPVFPGWIWSDQFVKSGAILVPRSAEEVAHCLQMVVEKDYRARIQTELEPARQRFLRQWVGQADGQASARIEALARRMAKYS
ncbi:MAG: hypothetical protein A2169_06905 [Deltaproteobacteria bacterium RBG_13_47_9]|nr:MAG: hypothetical protein A2169_06905 [Deltaproteobacteria bacterium RBG_13_47_9]